MTVRRSHVTCLTTSISSSSAIKHYAREPLRGDRWLSVALSYKMAKLSRSPDLSWESFQNRYEYHILNCQGLLHMDSVHKRLFKHATLAFSVIYFNMHVCMHEKRQEAVFEGRVTLLGKCKETSIYLVQEQTDLRKSLPVSA